MCPFTISVELADPEINEVQYMSFVISTNQYIFWFDVAMQYIVFVNVLQYGEQLISNVEDAFD